MVFLLPPAKDLLGSLRTSFVPDKVWKRPAFTTLEPPFCTYENSLACHCTPSLSPTKTCPILYVKEPGTPQAKNLPSSQFLRQTLPSFARKISSPFRALESSRFLSATLGKWEERGNVVEACRRIEGLRVVTTQPSEGWLIPSFNLRLPRREQPSSPPSCGGPCHQQPGPRRVSPFPAKPPQ
ncbi:hypothetical protein GWK47_035368 [Chionoecetes opilio]|uniref:Uncharacterized protein n=1 Tax=Chionoecetes opilio TaxID=41210 RepID=A0A8J4YNA5_CHIOP|nr:hypothetical protein GWK47_035368 [Chionoecetes opilio]